MTLKEIRNEIDALDAQMLEILKKRQDLVVSAARFKDCEEGENGVIVPARISSMLNNIEKQADELGVDRVFARKLYQSIIDHMIGLEMEEWRRDDSTST